MTITRSEIVKMLAERSGYFQKHVDFLLKEYDKLIIDLMNTVTEDEDVTIQIFKGVKIGCKIVPERTKKIVKDQSEITIGPTVKPFAKWSKHFRDNIQDQEDD